ncbi:MAG: cation ABC transporter substrate-binding protein [Deltaproteobacteria bacterium]|nr:cation ABC transporter substrate-binding protein [Deltaproteobacteria bacterium]
MPHAPLCRAIFSAWASAILCFAVVAPVQAQPLTIVTSIVPQEYFVERIAGPDVRIMAMVQPGASPASYEPTPEQMAALSKASVFFTIGVPFEKGWVPRMRTANPDLLFVDMGQGLERRPITGHRQDHGPGHVHEGEILDPHVWLSPPLVRIMAQTIRDVLQELNPGQAHVYAANYQDFVREIDRLDLKIIDIFGHVPEQRRRFMVFHPSWGYFAHAYGLEQMAIERHGKEPGPRDMAEILSEAKKRGIEVIFVQPEFSTRNAETLARDIGANVVTVNPLTRDWSKNLLQAARAFAGLDR